LECCLVLLVDKNFHKKKGEEQKYDFTCSWDKDIQQWNIKTKKQIKYNFIEEIIHAQENILQTEDHFCSD